MLCVALCCPAALLLPFACRQLTCGEQLDHWLRTCGSRDCTQGHTHTHTRVQVRCQAGVGMTNLSPFHSMHANHTPDCSLWVPPRCHSLTPAQQGIPCQQPAVHHVCSHSGDQLQQQTTCLRHQHCWQSSLLQGAGAVQTHRVHCPPDPCLAALRSPLPVCPCALPQGPCQPALLPAHLAVEEHALRIMVT